MGFNVYCLGSNGRGQLGLGHCNDVMVAQKSIVQSSDEVRKVVCGGNHTVLLLEGSGSVLATGNNEFGQLVGGPVVDYTDWVDCNGPWSTPRVLDVAAGWEFTAIVDENNIVRSRGAGPRGELGVGLDTCSGNSNNSGGGFCTVMECGSDDEVKLFASFANCVAVVTTKGGHCTVYGWGSNTKCQLQTPKSKIVDRPVVIYETDDPVDYAALGKNFNVLVNKRGEIVHAAGNLPSGFHWEHWKGVPGLQVRCMWSSIHILDLKGSRLSFGFNLHGQLLDTAFPQDMYVTDTCMGSEHGVVVVKELDGSQRVLAWGWGEHGNCGRLSPNQSDSDPTSVINDKSNEVSPLNEILVVDPDKKVKVWGGCATTWIVVSS
ncbi:Ats1p KNAG_0D04760 [Huiozyma naganishii CBS 8797]|uniref:Uncharacterized protein n=1 Tax=Huiozyma naganishii (strain ATCC MYA-139 / BCRC 22969 / CBS 8797 / KCTC 17520 / NBRC 10181 / NCYC 3082 / Yp74L-3) TaxID=1071383 RepID=J7S7A9_HUIN7|nr:hypothetical protein KNAG_0D04760 [Kazachstania naganishii CBS 8797]CCK70216.1 hypothetical protein KNAG_0D04760 [Kazachstania naganishii CBS 8797]